MKIYFLFIIAIGFRSTAQSQTISASKVKNFIRKNVTVCDRVANVKYAVNINKEPTFLDFGAKYPNEIFTVLVWGDDLIKFPYSLKSLEGRTICISGIITLYKGKPEIIVHDPDQIRKEN